MGDPQDFNISEQQPDIVLPKEPQLSALERSLKYVENGITLAVFGIVASVMAIFIYGPIFTVCALLALVAVRRSGAVEGLSGRKTVVVYIAVAVLSGSSLYWFGHVIENHRDHIPSVEEIVAAIRSGNPPPPGPIEAKHDVDDSSHTQIYFARPVKLPEGGAPEGGYATPYGIYQNELQPFRAGETPKLNVYWKNNGSSTILDSKFGAIVTVIPIDKYATVFDDNKGRVRQDVAGGVILPNKYPADHFDYFTFSSQMLTEKQATGLNTGKTALCVVGLMEWRDKTGTYETDYAQCLWHALNVLNWHELSQNNRERRLGD